MISENIHRRYLQDPLPVRLGGLAADLARIASFAENPNNHEAVAHLFQEGKYFAEWAAPDAPIETQWQLAQVQTWLSLWHRRWLAGATDAAMRVEAQSWSDRLLELSGLLS